MPTSCPATDATAHAFGANAGVGWRTCRLGGVHPDAEVADMGIKVVIEFRAVPGAGEEVARLLAGVLASLGPDLPGFRGSTLHDVIGTPDALVEIAEWDSPDAQAEAVARAMESGVYAPVLELLAEPLRVTRISARD
jgi:hypothetical protein